MRRSIPRLSRLLRAPLAILLAFLVGAAGILASEPRSAEAAAPTAITYTGSAANTGLANTPTTWTVGFTSTAGGALAAGGTITAQFHTAFVTPAGPVAVTLGSTFVGCTGTATSVASVVTITLANAPGLTCALAASTAATVAIPNILNPTAATYAAGAAANFRVQTSADNTFANHATNIVISPTAVTTVTFTGSPLAPSISSNYTVAFTVGLGGSLASGGTITATFHSSFAVPATPTINLGAMFVNCSATATGASSVVTITLANSGGTCALAASTTASLVIVGVTNPAVGTYAAAAFSVATSKDVTPASPAAAASVTITATTPTAVTFAGTPQTPGSTASWVVGFTPSAVGALAAASTITVTFDAAFTVPATPTITLSAAFSNCSAGGAATGTVVTVTLANSGGTCALNSLTPATVTIAGITNPIAGVYAAAGFGVSTNRDTTTALPANVTIATTAVTAVTLVGTPQTPGATASWAVGFTPSAVGALAAGNTITVTFDPAFTIPATPTITLATGFSGCTATGATVGSVVTVTLVGGGCSLNGLTPASFAIAGITNPAAAVYAAAGFGVRTTKDGTTVLPANVTIATTAVTAVTLVGTPQSPGTTASWAVGFTPSAVGALAAGNTVTVTFDPAFTIPATPTITLATGFSGCTATGATVGTVVTITLAGGGCALNGLTPASLSIAGITNPGAAVYAAAGFGVRTSRDATTVLPANVTIATTAVTAVTFVGSVTAPSTVAAWTVGFTPTAAGSLAAGNTITATFDSAFTVPATPTITLSAAFLNCSATGATVSNAVTITLANSGGTCALGGLTPGAVTIAGITNPVAAVYAGAGFSVRTSKDGTNVSPANVTIAATGVTAVTFTGTPAKPTTTAAWAVGFTTSAAGALANANTITVTFNSAFTVPATPTITLVSGFTSCSATGSTTARWSPSRWRTAAARAPCRSAPPRASPSPASPTRWRPPMARQRSRSQPRGTPWRSSRRRPSRLPPRRLRR